MPSVSSAAARPFAPVVTEAGAIVPSPTVTTNATWTPAMFCPYWSFTRTARGEASLDPATARWLSPETFSRVVAAGRGGASMLNSTERLPIVALTLTGPAVGPKVTVAEAIPLALVTAEAGPPGPFPATKANATWTPAMTCPYWSFTRMARGAASLDPTIARWLSPETFSRVVAARKGVASMLKSTERL